MKQKKLRGLLKQQRKKMQITRQSGGNYKQPVFI